MYSIEHVCTSLLFHLAHSLPLPYLLTAPSPSHFPLIPVNKAADLIRRLPRPVPWRTIPPDNICAAPGIHRPAQPTLGAALPQTLRVVPIRRKISLPDLLALLVLGRLVQPGLHAVNVVGLGLVRVPAPEQVLPLVGPLCRGAVLHVADVFGEVFGPRGGVVGELVVPFEGRAAVLGAHFVVEL